MKAMEMREVNPGQFLSISACPNCGACWEVTLNVDAREDGTPTIWDRRP